MVEATLSDPRGWSRAGFRFVRRLHAPFSIVLAEGHDVDRLCLPYDTYGEYSCQNGPVVALNRRTMASGHAGVDGGSGRLPTDAHQP